MNLTKIFQNITTVSFCFHLSCEQLFLLVLFSGPFPRGQILASISSTFTKQIWAFITFLNPIDTCKNPHFWPFPKGPNFIIKICTIYNVSVTIFTPLHFRYCQEVVQIPFGLESDGWISCHFSKQKYLKSLTYPFSNFFDNNLFSVPKILFDLSWFNLIFCSDNRQAC